MAQTNKDLAINGVVVDNSLCMFSLTGKSGALKIIEFEANEVESFSYEVADNGSAYINSMTGQPAVYDDKGVSVSGTITVFDSLQKKLNDAAQKLNLQNLVDFGRSFVTFPCQLTVKYVLNDGSAFTIILNDIKFERYGYDSANKVRSIPFKALQELHPSVV